MIRHSDYYYDYLPTFAKPKCKYDISRTKFVKKLETAHVFLLISLPIFFQSGPHKNHFLSYLKCRTNFSDGEKQPTHNESKIQPRACELLLGLFVNCLQI